MRQPAMGVDMDTTMDNQAGRVGNGGKEVGNGNAGGLGARETSSPGVSGDSYEKLDVTIPLGSADEDQRAMSETREREDGSSGEHPVPGTPSHSSGGVSTSASPSNHDNPPSSSSAVDSRSTRETATAVEAEESNIDKNNVDLPTSAFIQSPRPLSSQLVPAAQELENARSTSSPVPGLTSQSGSLETQVDTPGLGIPFELQQPEPEIIANEMQVDALPSAIVEPEPELPVDMGRLLNSIDITKVSPTLHLFDERRR